MSVICWTWLAENTGRKNSPSVHHHCTTLSGYGFRSKALSTIGKNVLNTAISPPHVLTVWWTPDH